MSKYIVTSNSYFKPFSYEEIVKPLREQTEVYNATADAYDQLSLESEALRNYISENEGDRQAKQLYDNYMNKLSSLQKNLYDNGINSATRRDLSSARAGYASDITRLQKAIQSRQERSKEYWDARHKDPDLVSGFDPGTSGLDNYLGDSEYGRNWYSYSGTQFASEVGAEAKARANELIESVVDKDPQLAGYLIQKTKEGFSSQEVDNASAYALAFLNGSLSKEDYSRIPADQRILADVLISRLQATGARPGENVSREEFMRLFNYGRLGLAQGIGKTEEKTLNDKIWEDAAARSRIRYQKALSNSTSGGAAYERELVNRQVRSANAEKESARLAKIFNDEEYRNGKTVSVNIPGRGVVSLSSPDEALQLFQTERSNKFFDSTGLDVRRRSSNWMKTRDSKQYGNYKGTDLLMEEAGAIQQMKHGLNPGDLIVKKAVGGKYVYDAIMTENANRARREYRNNISRIESANPDLDINSIGLTPEEQKRLRKELPVGISDSDLRYAAESKYELGDRYGIPIANGPEDSDIKIRIANTINGIYANTHGKRDWKNVPWGFYKVEEGNSGYNKENSAIGENGLSNVFTVGKNGQIDPNSIYTVYVLPGDIKDGKVKVRMETSEGTFITDISTLGDELNGAMNDRFVSALELLMTPLNNVVEVLDRNDNTGDGWDSYVNLILKDYNKPIVGNRTATAQEVVRDPRLQKELLDGITDYLLDAISYDIDPISINHRQHRGYTSSKAAGVSEEEE